MPLFRRIDLLLPRPVSDPAAPSPLLTFLGGLGSRQGALLRVLADPDTAVNPAPAADGQLSAAPLEGCQTIGWDDPDRLLQPPDLIACHRVSLLQVAQSLAVWPATAELPAVLVLEDLTPAESMQLSGLLVLDDHSLAGEAALWMGVTLAQLFQSRLLITGVSQGPVQSSPGGATPIGATAESYPFWDRLSHLDWRTIAGGVRVALLAEVSPSALSELLTVEQLSLSILPTANLADFESVPGMLLLLPSRSATGAA